jgi:hypothetical protein
MSDDDRWREVQRNWARYNGPWAGDVHGLLTEHTRLRNRLDSLVRLRSLLAECDGDMEAVRVPHEVFKRLMEGLE